jgi:hypothetical protein
VRRRHDGRVEEFRDELQPPVPRALVEVAQGRRPARPSESNRAASRGGRRAPRPTGTGGSTRARRPRRRRRRSPAAFFRLRPNGLTPASSGARCPGACPCERRDGETSKRLPHSRRT